MKFSFSWLKEHLDTQLNAIEISEKLTSIGLEVESFNDASLAFRDFIVAEVIEVALDDQGEPWDTKNKPKHKVL